MVAVATKTKRKIVLGPKMVGRKMALDDFDTAPTADGHLYKLGKGVVAASEIPSADHVELLQELRDALTAYPYTCGRGQPV